MFRSKRSNLVRELWRLRIPQNDPESQNEKESHESKAIIHSMLKRLKEKSLENLLRSVSSKGREQTPCVPLPNVELKMGKLSTDPHVVCCQIWRWPDLASDATLRRMPCCETDITDPLYVCCNPHHWSIQQNTESTCCAEKANFLTSGINWPSDICMDPDSTETGLTPTCRKNGDGDTTDPRVGVRERGADHWCSVAYWELRQRLGRLYTVHEPYLCVFQDLPHANGMSLALVQQQTPQTQPVTTSQRECSDGGGSGVRRTRDKIGLGVVLSREASGVWLYNRSDFPVFVNSPTLDFLRQQPPPPDPRDDNSPWFTSSTAASSVVIRVNPGHSLQIFDYDVAAVMRAAMAASAGDERARRLQEGPYDPSSVRISFAKGWGPSYHRQFITSCPAWIEVLLNVTDR